MTTTKTKSIWRSKTFWFNLLAGTSAVLESSQVTDVVPQEFMPYIWALVAAVNIILRANTTKPVKVDSPRMLFKGK